MDDLSLTSWLVFALILAFAGLVHGTLGLGFPVLATPLLALMVDVRLAILITLLPTATVNLGSIIQGGNWSESIGRFWPLALYSVIGGVVG
ncbi:MAG: putative membrane protein YfcA, partial [Gammaproteobacteria bacterium]